MLSYQHIYHAGNLADVHKHAILAETLAYLTQKDKPLSYIETHSGRGLYHLDSDQAVQTGEAAAGIERALTEDWFSADHPLSRAIAAVQARYGQTAYPGSPLIAANLLRSQDKMHLAELHPQEYRALSDALVTTDARTYRQDGFELAQSLLPPTPRRGVLLIDPSYEIKSDYDRLPGIIASLNRKWNVGVVALWYPILANGRHQAMRDALAKREFPKVLHHEVQFPAARKGHGMVGSGMFVVNAPYGLSDSARTLDNLFGRLSA
ncbi:23S rRNA (adenine(2030)-N(6))-methyltransferase RlmJ [Ruegeria sp. Ofav3-42]|uniref:23S rRNA (adenine(2030)-N(6))-methyltransferase RlmJ n=1 Tax=Ruegeria sp. Ofav3-42 TaxID=2917759 RepID=UPI001EF7488B|nr:23S rRNA (adenine(2030)-N(6))-methyltransferase RlmJ [Ruegeria sp. Ofav3-42]MCG7520119.1 23S rRNA (adenine(2030)-N(6))-methyltransferase RlmJ [Ruegeria sp. Ofav3-42]